MQKKIAVVGGGAWGTTIAKVLCENGHLVKLWEYENEVADDINQNHMNSKFLYGVKLPESLKSFKDLGYVCQEADFIFMANPSIYLIEYIRKVSEFENVKNGYPIIICTAKGFIDQGDKLPKLLLDALEAELPWEYRNKTVYVSGPSHAEEVSRGKYTGLISASLSKKNAIIVRGLLRNAYLNVFSSFDIIGVQVCAAMKNIMAIAYGAVDAMKRFTATFGDNTEAMLLAACLNEIMRLGVAMGSSTPETFTSFAGIGDLEATCRSEHGRNRRFGKELIERHLMQSFNDLDDLISKSATLGYLPEGIFALKHAMRLAEYYKLNLPITTAIYSALNKKTTPEMTVSLLMQNLPALFEKIR